MNSSCMYKVVASQSGPAESGGGGETQGCCCFVVVVEVFIYVGTTP